MPERRTLQFWYCPHQHRNPPSERLCVVCGHNYYQRNAQVSAAERAVIDLSPDGSISIPGRADVPLHPKQVAAGVERVEITSALAGQYSLRALEQRGLIHEATNWNSGGNNVPIVAEELPEIKPKSIEQILAEPDAF